MKINRLISSLAAFLTSGAVALAQYPSWKNSGSIFLNGRALAWGNEHGQGKVVMHFMSPPHVKMECYFSGADVAGEGRLPMNEWIHIFHTYEKGDSRIYVVAVRSLPAIASARCSLVSMAVPRCFGLPACWH